MDYPDFTLPNDITNSAVSVKFGEAGQVTEIAMES